jgi:hypothetical protein
VGTSSAFEREFPVSANQQSSCRFTDADFIFEALIPK